MPSETSAFVRRQKCRSCSGSWPPETRRWKACAPSCCSGAAQPMTAQREVDAGPRPSAPVTAQSLGADTLTSNQSVFLSPSTHLACLGSLPPPPAEEVYVQQLVNRCKAAVLLLWKRSFSHALRACCVEDVCVSSSSLVFHGKPNRSVCTEMCLCSYKCS